jgi:hypothetical protein
MQNAASRTRRLTSTASLGQFFDPDDADQRESEAAFEAALERARPAGCRRIVVHFTGGRGRKTEGRWPFDLPRDAPVTALRAAAAQRLGVSASRVGMESFSGSVMAPSDDPDLTIGALLGGRVTAYALEDESVFGDDIFGLDSNDGAQAGVPRAGESDTTAAAAAAPVLPPPPQLLCSLTGRLFEDPVLSRHGHTYERSAAEALLAAAEKRGETAVDPKQKESLGASADAARCCFRRPRTGAAASLPVFVPNLVAEAAVDEYRRSAAEARRDAALAATASKVGSGSPAHGRLLFRQASRDFSDPPDYLCDPITFEPFTAPVVSRSGNSFETAVALQMIFGSGKDPISGLPMTEAELVPNRLALELMRRFREELELAERQRRRRTLRRD